tara:strand:- start:129 stop:1097 length:969 start_codon:yes stop_codon:yes gene_type:complete
MADGLSSLKYGIGNQDVGSEGSTQDLLMFLAENIGPGYGLGEYSEGIQDLLEGNISGIPKAGLGLVAALPLGKTVTKGAQKVVDEGVDLFKNLNKNSKIYSSDRWDSAFQRTYGQGKVESAYKERIKQIDKANKEGKKIKDYELKLPDSETVLVENVALNPKILKNVQGVHGEHIVRDSGQKLKRLEKNIKEKGYKQKDPIQIYVREDGTPFINEGNHRVAEAIKNNRPIINARIHYKGGSEKVKGEFNPFNILPEEKATDISTSLNISAEDLTTYNKFENYLNTLQNKIQSLLEINKLIGKAKGGTVLKDYHKNYNTQRLI